jgi:hypothetical protein
MKAKKRKRYLISAYRMFLKRRFKRRRKRINCNNLPTLPINTPSLSLLLQIKHLPKQDFSSEKHRTLTELRPHVTSKAYAKSLTKKKYNAIDREKLRLMMR